MFAYFVDDDMVNVIDYPQTPDGEARVRALPPYAVQVRLPAGTPVTIDGGQFNVRYPANFAIEGRYTTRTQFIIEKSPGRPIDLLTTLDVVATISGVPNGWPAIPGNFGFLPVEDALTVRRSNVPISLRIFNRPAISEVDAGLRVYASVALTVVPFPPPGSPPPGTPVVGGVVTPIPLPSPVIVEAREEFVIPTGSRILYPTDSHFPIGDRFVFPDESIAYFPKRTILPAILLPDSVLPSGERVGGVSPMTAAVTLHHGGMAYLRGVRPVLTGADIFGPEQQAFDIDMRGGGRFYGEGTNYTVSVVSRTPVHQFTRLVTVVQPIITSKIAVVRMGLKRFRWRRGGYLGVGVQDEVWQWLWSTHGQGVPERVTPSWAISLSQWAVTTRSESMAFPPAYRFDQYNEPPVGEWRVTMEYPLSQRFLNPSDFTRRVPYKNSQEIYYYPDPDQFSYSSSDFVSGYKTVTLTVTSYEPHDEIEVQGAQVTLPATLFTLRAAGGCYQGTNPGTVGVVTVSVAIPPLCDKDEPGLCWYFYRENHINNRLTAPLPGGAQCYAYSPTSIDPILATFSPGTTTRYRVKTTLIATETGTVSINIEPDSVFHPFTGSQVIPRRPYRLLVGEMLYSPYKVRGKFLTHTNIESFPELQAAWAVPHDSSSLRITLVSPGGFYPGGSVPHPINDQVVLPSSYDEDTEFVLPAEFVLPVVREVVRSPWEQLTLRRVLTLPENTSIFDPDWGDLATIVLSNGERPRGIALGQRLNLTLVHTVIAIDGGTLVTDLSVRLSGGRARFQLQNNNWWNLFDIQYEPLYDLPYLEFNRRDVTGAWYHFLTGQYYTQGLNCAQLGYIPPCSASPQIPATLTREAAIWKNQGSDIFGRVGRGHYSWAHLQTPGWFHHIWVLENPTRTTLFPGLYGGKTVAYNLSQRHFVLTPDADMFVYNPDTKETRTIERGSVIDLLDGIVYPPGAKHRLPRVASDKRLVSSGESHIYIDRPVTLRTDFPINEVHNVDEGLYGSIALRQRAGTIRMSVHYVRYDMENGRGTPMIGTVTLAGDLRGRGTGRVVRQTTELTRTTLYERRGFPERYWYAYGMVWHNIVRFRTVPVRTVTATTSVPVLTLETRPGDADLSEPRYPQGKIVMPANSHIIIPPAHQMEFFSRPRFGHGAQLKGAERAELPQGAVAVIPPGATLTADRVSLITGLLPDGTYHTIYVVDTFTLPGPAHMALGSTVSGSDEGGAAHFVNHDDYFSGDPIVFLNEPGNLVHLRNAEERNVHVPIQQNTRFDINGWSENWTERGLYRNALPSDVGEFYGDFPLLYAVAPECRGEVSEGRECAEDEGEGLVFKVEDGEEYHISEPLIAPEPVLMAADINGGELEVEIRSATGAVLNTLSEQRIFIRDNGMVQIRGATPRAHDILVVRPKKTGSQGRRVKLRAYVGATRINMRDLSTLSYAETEGSFTIHVGGYLGDNLDDAAGKARLLRGQRLSLGVGALLRGDIGINERRYGVFGVGGNADLLLPSGPTRLALDDYRLVKPEDYNVTVSLSADAGDIDSTGSAYHRLAAGQVFRVSARAPESFGISVVDYGRPINALGVASSAAIVMEPGYLWQGYIPAQKYLKFTPNSLRNTLSLPGGGANPLGATWPPGKIYMRVQPSSTDRLNLWGSGTERLEGLDPNYGVQGRYTRTRLHQSELGADSSTVTVVAEGLVGDRLETTIVIIDDPADLADRLDFVKPGPVSIARVNFTNYVRANFGSVLMTIAATPEVPAAGFLAGALHPTISLVVRVRNLVDGSSELATVHWNPVAVEGGATVRAVRWNHARNDVFAGPVTAESVTVTDNATLIISENTRMISIAFTVNVPGEINSVTVTTAGSVTVRSVPASQRVTMTAGGIRLREITGMSFGDQAMWVAPRNTMTAGIAVTVVDRVTDPDNPVTMIGNTVSASDYTNHGERSYIDNFMCNGVPARAYYNMAPFPVATSKKAPLKKAWWYEDYGRQIEDPTNYGSPFRPVTHTSTPPTPGVVVSPRVLNLTTRQDYEVWPDEPEWRARTTTELTPRNFGNRTVPSGIGVTVRSKSDLFFYLDRAIEGPYSWATVRVSSTVGISVTAVLQDAFQRVIQFGGDFVMPGPAAFVPPFAARSEEALADVYASRSKFFSDAVGWPNLSVSYGAKTGNCGGTNNCAAMWTNSQWPPILHGVLATDPAVDATMSAVPGRADQEVRLMMPQPEAVVQMASGNWRVIYAGSILYPRNNFIVPSRRLKKGNYELKLFGPAHAAVDVSPAIGLRPRFFRQNQEGEFTADRFNPTPIAVPATVTTAVTVTDSTTVTVGTEVVVTRGTMVLDVRRATLTLEAGCVVEPLYFVASQQTLFSTQSVILTGGASLAATVTVLGGRDFIAHTGYDTSFSRGFLANSEGSEFQAGYLSGRKVEHYRKAGPETAVNLQTIWVPTLTVSVPLLTVVPPTVVGGITTTISPAGTTTLTISGVPTIVTITAVINVMGGTTVTLVTAGYARTTLWGDRVRSIVDPFASNEYIPDNRHDLFPLNYDFRVPPPQSYPWLHGVQPGVKPIVTPEDQLEYKLRVSLIILPSEPVQSGLRYDPIEKFEADTLGHPGFSRVNYVTLAAPYIKPVGTLGASLPVAGTAFAEVYVRQVDTAPSPVTLDPAVFKKTVIYSQGQIVPEYYKVMPPPYSGRFVVLASVLVPNPDRVIRRHDIPLGVDRVSLGTSQEAQEAVGIQLRSEGNEFTALRLAHRIRIPETAVTRFDVHEPRGTIPYPRNSNDFFQFPVGSEALVVKADAGSWLSAHPYIARNAGSTVRVHGGGNYVISPSNDGVARFDISGMRVMHYLRAQEHGASPSYSRAPIYTNVWLRLPSGGELRNTETGEIIGLPEGAILNPVLGTWVHEERGVVEEGEGVTEGRNLRNNYLAAAQVAADVDLDVVRPALVFPERTKFVIKGEASITNVKAAVIFSLSPLPFVGCPTGGFDLMTGQGGVEGDDGELVGIDQIREGVSETRYEDATGGTGAVGAGHPCAWGDDPENLDGDRTYIYRSRRRYVNPDVQARTLSNDRTYLLGGRLAL